MNKRTTSIMSIILALLLLLGTLAPFALANHDCSVQAGATICLTSFLTDNN